MHAGTIATPHLTRRLVLLMTLATTPACATAQTAGPQVDDPWSGKYPTATIGNEHVAARLMLPDAEAGFYRGVRFDHAGIVSRVAIEGHTFYGPIVAPTKHQPTAHDHIAGLCHEFGMDDPLGYDEASPGEPFVKVGVGVLKRRDKGRYRFNRSYDLIDRGEWKIERQVDRITFEHTVDGPRGWSYEYTKTVRVPADAPELIVERTLKNTGSKTIDTTQYCHNFTFMDDQPFNGDYIVRFPFEAEAGTQFNDRGVCEFTGGDLDFIKGMQGGAVWGLVAGYDPNQASHNGATVANEATGAVVSYRVDRPLAKLVVYAKTPAVCPEPFIAVHVEPGKQMQWQTTYTFAGGE